MSRRTAEREYRDNAAGALTAIAAILGATRDWDHTTLEDIATLVDVAVTPLGAPSVLDTAPEAIGYWGRVLELSD